MLSVHFCPIATQRPRAGPLPPGWEIDPADAREIPLGAMEYRGREVTLVSVALLRDEDLAQLAAQTGQPTAAVGFGMHLLVALGVVKRGRRVMLQEDRWRVFNATAMDDRLAGLCRDWLEMTGWSELALVAGMGGPFQLRGRLGGPVGR